MYEGKNACTCLKRLFLAYRISLNNSRGRFFSFRTKTGRLFEKGRRALNILFYYPIKF